MIYLGQTSEQKRRIVAEERRGRRVVVISPATFRTDFDEDDWLDWDSVIKYAPFYRLLQEINNDTLLVLDECLRLQNRNDLFYNCIRHYLAQTGHVVIFQWFPCITTREDFAVLFDFDTGSRWKRQPFKDLPIDECDLRGVLRIPDLTVVTTEVPDKTKKKYATQRDRLFDTLGTKDPHTIPRTLHLLGGAHRLAVVTHGVPTARNKRLGIQTYGDVAPDTPISCVDIPHRLRDLTDALAITQQSELQLISSDLPVDVWYTSRVQEAFEEMRYVFATVSGL